MSEKASSRDGSLGSAPLDPLSQAIMGNSTLGETIIIVTNRQAFSSLSLPLSLSLPSSPSLPSILTTEKQEEKE